MNETDLHSVAQRRISYHTGVLKLGSEYKPQGSGGLLWRFQKRVRDIVTSSLCGCLETGVATAERQRLDNPFLDGVEDSVISTTVPDPHYDGKKTKDLAFAMRQTHGSDDGRYEQLQRLALACVEGFDNEIDVFEMVALAASKDREVISAIIRKIGNKIDHSRFQNPAMLRALAHTLRLAEPVEDTGGVDHGDLVTLLDIVHKAVETAHQGLVEEGERQDARTIQKNYELLCTVNTVLDMMALCGVTGIAKQTLYDPLKVFLEKLSQDRPENSHWGKLQSIKVSSQAQCCLQALLRLDSSESQLEHAIDQAKKVASASSGFIKAILDKDPKESVYGFVKLCSVVQWAEGTQDWYDVVKVMRHLAWRGDFKHFGGLLYGPLDGMYHLEPSGCFGRKKKRVESHIWQERAFVMSVVSMLQELVAAQNSASEAAQQALRDVREWISPHKQFREIVEEIDANRQTMPSTVLQQSNDTLNTKLLKQAQDSILGPKQRALAHFFERQKDLERLVIPEDNQVALPVLVEQDIERDAKKTLKSLIADGKHVVLSGNSGMGVTTLLRQTALSMAKEAIGDGAFVGFLPIEAPLGLYIPINEGTKPYGELVGTCFEDIPTGTRVVILADRLDRARGLGDLFVRNHLAEKNVCLVVSLQRDKMDKFKGSFSHEHVNLQLPNVSELHRELADEVLRDMAKCFHLPWETFASVGDMRALCDTPELASLLLPHLTRLQEEGDIGNPGGSFVDKTRLYEALMRCFFRGKEEEYQRNGHTLPSLTIEERKKAAFSYALAVARDMFIRGVPYIDETRFTGGITDADLLAYVRAIAPLQIDNNTQQGPRELKKMIHTSVKLFLQAKVLIEELKSTSTLPAPKTLLLFSQNAWEHFELFSFLAGWIAQDKNVQDKSVQERLFAVIECSKTDASYAKAAGNALTALVAARVSLSGRNFTGCRFDTANISTCFAEGTIFDNCTFATLIAVQGCFLRASFRNARIDNLQIGQKTLRLPPANEHSQLAFSPLGHGVILTTVCQDSGVAMAHYERFDGLYPKVYRLPEGAEILAPFFSKDGTPHCLQVCEGLVSSIDVESGLVEWTLSMPAEHAKVFDTGVLLVDGQGNCKLCDINNGVIHFEETIGGLKEETAQLCDGKYIICATDALELSCIDLNTKKRSTLQTQRAIDLIAPCKGEALFAVAQGDELRFYEIVAHELCERLAWRSPPFHQEVTRISWPGGSELQLGFHDGTVRRYDVNRGVVGIFPAHAAEVVEVSNGFEELLDGKEVSVLASIGMDQKVMFWDLSHTIFMGDPPTSAFHTPFFHHGDLGVLGPEGLRQWSINGFEKKAIEYPQTVVQGHFSERFHRALAVIGDDVVAISPRGLECWRPSGCQLLEDTEGVDYRSLLLVNGDIATVDRAGRLALWRYGERIERQEATFPKLDRLKTDLALVSIGQQILGVTESNALVNIDVNARTHQILQEVPENIVGLVGGDGDKIFVRTSGGLTVYKKTSERLSSIKTIHCEVGACNNIVSVGDKVFFASEDAVHILDGTKHHATRRLLLPRGQEVADFVVSADGSWVAVAMRSGEVLVYRSDTLATIATVGKSGKSVRLSVDPQSNTLIVHRKAVSCYDIDISKKRAATLRFKTNRKTEFDGAQFTGCRYPAEHRPMLEG